MKEILNYLQVSENIHTSGQPTRHQLSQLAEYGIRQVINLAMTTSDNAVADEGYIVAGQGIRYFHLPVVWENPTKEDYTLFSRVIAGVEHLPSLVHCALNMRVSAFMYLYRVLEKGVPEGKAMSELQKIWIPSDQWYHFINTILNDNGRAAMDLDVDATP